MTVLSFVERWISVTTTVVVMTLSLVGLVFFFSFDATSKQGELHQAVLNGKVVQLEIADEPDEITQGLSDRESMPRGHGMLFVLEPAGVYPFWMNRMHFPLDIIWINGGVVVDVVTLPPPKVGELPATHRPNVVADRVLELNAGESTVYGLRIGQTVDGLEDF